MKTVVLLPILVAFCSSMSLAATEISQMRCRTDVSSPESHEVSLLDLPNSDQALRSVITDLSSGASDLQALKVKAIGFEGSVFRAENSDKTVALFLSKGGGSTLTLNGKEYRCRVTRLMQANRLIIEKSDISLEFSRVSVFADSDSDEMKNVITFSFENLEAGAKVAEVKGSCNRQSSSANFPKALKFAVDPIQAPRTMYVVDIDKSAQAGDVCDLEFKIQSAAGKTLDVVSTRVLLR